MMMSPMIFGQPPTMGIGSCEHTETKSVHLCCGLVDLYYNITEASVLLKIASGMSILGVSSNK